MESRTFSTESYFQTQRPPSGLAERTQKMTEFVDKWRAVPNQRVVLVTSGGTTVPLEANTVRFLDNFSAGTRGATSAEHFLSAGYAVIFLHRLHSLRPFSRHYSHSLNPFLDLLSVVQSSSDTAVSEHAKSLLPILQAHQKAQSEGKLLSVDFQTVNEYLWLLKSVTSVLAPLQRRGMFYLAAAVSDFFLPEDRIAEHKIQSVHGTLSLEMDQVPKVLKPLVQEWNPEGYIVSFKLETDSTLLIPKSRAALSRYGHQLVIGNELHHRKQRVVFVEPAHPSSTPRKARADERIREVETPPLMSGDGVDSFRETWLRLEDYEGKRTDGNPESELEIEELIIKELVQRHTSWIEAGYSSTS
ncbi:putative phosphopantothenate-cysteine ligase [Kockovaella imperatae]|uniref:Putative phosphopantothenate-cysteine ligase n=1 Tax=Kockovaella imperatae TaxID=4999 RepID=A0A1Y1UKB1_9TREE|nr:putative phosphopantothenate-cysteine ligase [Kockovaella imperatae]ORX38493.1 putative phosphopantothenate-cysteine ligase [Kockovaella imperatae]